MTDDSSHERRTGRGNYSRRGYLATAGAIGIGVVDGSAGSPIPPDWTGTVERTPPESEPRSDFLWLGGSLWRDEGVRENLFAFARRHDAAVVLVKSRSPGESTAAELRPAMEAASERGLDVWLNVGMLNDVPAERFVADSDARAAHLQWLRKVAELHGELFDGGRIILWQEAPVMGQWDEGGEWTDGAVENLLDLGPEIFAAQKRAVEAANDTLDVGIFVHFPYIVDSKEPDVFRDLVAGLDAEGVEPDFGFVDFYRGWYEKDVGPEPANAAVHSLVTNTRDALGDRPVFYLGQSHTINPNHTPSKQAMRTNLRTSLDAGAAGVGWYVRTRYVPTESGFDPFVPNVEGVEITSDAVNTLTVARDRFLYAWMATLEASTGFAAADAFDLWLLGDGFGLYDHRLSLETEDGEWEYVGDFGGDADGDFPADSPVTDRATIFRALDRDRFLGDGELACRIETGDSSAGATLQSALVVPCEPTAYVSEDEAAELALRGADLEGTSLGRTTDEVALSPGDRRSVTVPVTDDSDGSLHELRHPEWADTVDRLASVEDREALDPGARFDLWVSGVDPGGTAAEQSTATPSLVGRDGGAHEPANDGVVAATDSLAICHGLRRERYLADGSLELGGDVPDAVEACYAMPYAGSATFRSPTRAAKLLREQPGEVEVFSLDSVELS